MNGRQKFNLVSARSRNRGCQMVYFQTKNSSLGKFCRALGWKMLIYFMAIRNILRTIGIFNDYLVHFVLIWDIFPVLVSRTMKNLATLAETSILLFMTGTRNLTERLNVTRQQLSDLFRAHTQKKILQKFKCVWRYFGTRSMYQTWIVLVYLFDQPSKNVFC
jgi:hypothetical protein